MTALATHPVPFSALDGKIGVLGITGSGKTFTAIGLVERILEANRQAIMVDPTGAYHGLRSAFPIPIFGGSMADVPITENDGEAVARAIIDKNWSAIVDVSLLLKESHASARRFMGPFIATMKNSPPAPRYLVMDEADEFMPENASGGEARLFGDLKWIVRRGRIEGWRMMMVTQRPQDIAKSVLTQCETLIIHNLTAPQDRFAVEAWVKGNADTAQAKEVLGSLASLDVGEAWIWSPKHKILERTKLPPNRSLDSSKTPEVGDAPRSAGRLKRVDLAELREVMKNPDIGVDDLPSKELRRQLTAAQMRISGLETQLSTHEQLGPARERQFAIAREQRAGAIVAAEEMIAGVETVIAETKGRLDLLVKKIDTETHGPAPIANDRADKAPVAAAAPPPKPAPVVNGALRPALQRAIEAIDWWRQAGFEPIDRTRATIIAGLSPKASTFGVYISELAGMGLVDTSELGKVSLTAAGRAASALPAIAPGTAEIQDSARKAAKLKPAEIKAFDAVVAKHPDWVDRGELADILGLSRSASTCGVYISKLSSFGFVETRRGEVRAADWLFLESR